MKTKIISYTPPEINQEISVDFYLEYPQEIQSKTLKTKRRALLIVDPNLNKDQVKIVENLIKTHVSLVKVFKIHYTGKNLESTEMIWSEMIDFRPDVAIALGGGTVCDLVGFTSSAYHRGMDHIFFPTTLLSMVDACIGGKTGIDFKGVKNSIGQVHYARESHCFFPLLETLNKDELMSGVSEIIKAAMLFDSKLFERLERLSKTFEISEEWFDVVSQSSQLKAKMSERPFSERSKLLYGHNIGHGIETYDSTHKRHGDCVAIGMNYELFIAKEAGIVSSDMWLRQNKLIKKFGLPFKFDNIDTKNLKKRIQLYKLYKNDMYLFVIPRSIGTVHELGDNYYWKLSESEFDSLISNLVNNIETI